MEILIYRINASTDAARVRRVKKNLYEIKALALDGSLIVAKVEIDSRNTLNNNLDVTVNDNNRTILNQLVDNNIGEFINKENTMENNEIKEAISSTVEETTETIKETINDVKEAVEETTVDTINVVETVVENTAVGITETKEEIETNITEDKADDIQVQTEDAVADTTSSVEETTPDKPSIEPTNENTGTRVFTEQNGKRLMKVAVVGAAGWLLWKTIKFLADD